MGRTPPNQRRRKGPSGLVAKEGCICQSMSNSQNWGMGKIKPPWDHRFHPCFHLPGFPFWVHFFDPQPYFQILGSPGRPLFVLQVDGLDLR